MTILSLQLFNFNCLFLVEQFVIFTSRPLLPEIKKDMLPASLFSNVVYNFLCHCDSRCVSRISQRLPDRIRQHAPQFFRTGQILNSRNISTRSGKSLKACLQPFTVLFSLSVIFVCFIDTQIHSCFREKMSGFERQ